ncbi:MAG: peptide chain release factor 2 [Clostridia bacterium]|nr:peptide chain release factor 2 [Clostridia bacterium]
MLEIEKYKSELQALKADIDLMGASIDPEAISDKVDELEHVAAEPGFWDDPERAQSILAKVKNLKSKLTTQQDMESRAEDLAVLIELSEAEDDQSVIDEIGHELASLREKFNEVKLSTLLTGKYDANNAILNFHAGAGGTEAMDWTGMLVRMYTRWGERHGFRVKILDWLDGEDAGVKSASLMIEGENAYGFLRSEKGIHRLVRISPFDSAGRRHTSFAAIEVMPELDDSIHIDINPVDLQVDTYRSSGSGGQKVNKTDSAVRITHVPTGIVVSCQTERSQVQNRATAMKMLEAKLFELKEREHKDTIDELKGVSLEIAWGSQIRSYVFCPYTLVKDHRTNYEEGTVNTVMDGSIDGFINAFLSAQANGTLVK